MDEDRYLQVYRGGPLTVVGFGGQEVLDHISIPECRVEISSLVENHHCRDLAFDLTGVKLLPSGMLGLLASLRDLGVVVHVYNPSDDIREVLEITKLDQLIQVHSVDVQSLQDDSPRT